MTSDEVDPFVGKRVRITRAEGSVFVGLLQPDSVSYVSLEGDELTRSIRYVDIASIDTVDAGTPDTN